jgi:formylglycine-generating enzyme required for sulfatase activity
MTGEMPRTSARETCGICQHPVEPAEERTQCPHCGLPFHADCWAENHGCSAYGCPQVNALKPPADESRAAPPQRSEEGGDGRTRTEVADLAEFALPQRSEEGGDGRTRGRPAPPPEPFPWDFLLLGASALGVLVSLFTFGVPSLVLLPVVLVANLSRQGKKSWAVFLLSFLVCAAGMVGGYVASCYLLPPAPPVLLDCTGDKGVGAAEVRKAQEAWAKYLGRQVEEEDEVAPGVKMKFVLVPPGRFLMGSPKDEKGRDDTEVQHEVEITKPFYLGAYDVTQAQYEAVTGKNPSNFKGSDLPVEQVSWEEADAFAKGLTEKAKGRLVYRLPREGEWEYACRGGRPSSEPFGVGDGTSLTPRDANFGDSHLGSTSPVGSYAANALGLYDMHGNVWQWCSDLYEPGSRARVLRGGGWVDLGEICRSARRLGYEPGGGNRGIGFRLARVPSGTGK